MRFRAASVSVVLVKTTPSKNRSIKQNSNRLAAYLATGIGAGLVAMPTADAAIVTIDITTTGFGIDGPNAGLSPNGNTLKSGLKISRFSIGRCRETRFFKNQRLAILHSHWQESEISWIFWFKVLILRFSCGFTPSGFFQV